MKKRRYRNRIIACLLAFFLLFQPTGQMVSLAAPEEEQQESVVSDEDMSRYCGLEPIQAIAIEDSDLQQSVGAALFYNQYSVYAVPSSVAGRDLDIYSNTYCYNRLTSQQKAVYDGLLVACKKLMNTQNKAASSVTDKGTIKERTVYLSDKVPYSNMTKDELAAVMYIFTYQNPQYYFVTNEIFYSDKYCYLGIYPEFADGAIRSSRSQAFFNQIDTWVKEVNGENTEYKKTKKVYELICKAVSYVQGDFNQSAYSAVIGKETVCAGYTKLYSILMNAVGIQTVGVTSQSHAWNRVFLDGQWYNVDATWGDSNRLKYAAMFLRSDSDMILMDGPSGETHVQRSFYNGVAPECPVNYTHFRITPALATLNLSGTKTLQLEPKFDREIIDYGDVTYKSLAPSVASVNSSGLVTAHSPGKAVIEARSSGSFEIVSSTVLVYQKMATPVAPTLASRTTNSITLNSVSGCLYSKDGVNWQSSPAFYNLASGTAYTFYTKKPADGYYTESAVSKGVTFETLYAPVSVSYRTHVQTYGWQGFVKNGVMSGTSGQAKRLEGIEIQVSGNQNLGIQYTTHCQTYGWLPWSADGDMSGTQGEAKRLEAIKIQLTGADKNKYDVYYRVHAQTYGWLGWAKNGAPAGTAGFAKRLEGIQIVVVTKGTPAPGINYAGVKGANQEAYYARAGASAAVPGADAPNVTYRTHVQTYGWQNWRYNGNMAGTTGQAKRLEGIQIKLTNAPCSGDIYYTTHVQTYGWQNNIQVPKTWKHGGQMAGTSGKAKRLEAICIALSGDMERQYDVYYRVHAQTFGWMGWAKNGAPAGSAGYAKRLEGIQIVLVPKGEAAPGSMVGAYISKYQ